MGRYVLAVAVAFIVGGISYATRPVEVEAAPVVPPHEVWVAESVRGCVAGLGLAKVTVQGTIVRVECRPSLGVLK